MKFWVSDSIVNLPGNLILKPAHLSTEEEFYHPSYNLKSAFSVVRALDLTKGLFNCLCRPQRESGVSNHELISCAKSGVEGPRTVCCQTYAKKNIRVNTVAPGVVDTPLSSKILITKRHSMSAKKSMLGEIGKPKDISNMISFFIDPENNWITGQKFVVMEV
ncbi:hypothetical protein Ct9H90mP29_08440 [bacterium]|nr:MAG: hypothetical protein Ct9H90mP29_08440 [bacterium]